VSADPGWVNMRQGLLFVLSDESVHVKLSVGLIYSRRGCHAGSMGSAVQTLHAAADLRCRQVILNAITLPTHAADSRQVVLSVANQVVRFS
jgi:hypothetical protein